MDTLYQEKQKLVEEQKLRQQEREMLDQQYQQLLEEQDQTPDYEAIRKENMALMKQVRKKYPAPKARKFPGTDRLIKRSRPRRTLKQKREDARVDRAMFMAGSYKDHVNFWMEADIQKENQRNANVRELYDEEFDTAQMSAIPFSFLHGFDTKTVNQKSVPATGKDAQIQEADRELMNDFTSPDYQRRWRHLDGMVDELVNTKLHTHMLSEDYLCKYSGAYKRLSRNVDDMKRLMNDPNNFEYFQHMDKEKKRKLDRAMDDNGPLMNFKWAFGAQAGARGVDIDTGSATNDIELIQSMQKKKVKLNKKFQDSLGGGR